jgi:uncharacterized iron-regulated membrane protein
MIQRFFLAFSGALFLGSAVAFFLFVPLLSLATVVLMVVGLMLMFGLGFQAGAKRMKPSERNAPVLLQVHDTGGFDEWESHQNNTERECERVA